MGAGHDPPSIHPHRHCNPGDLVGRRGDGGGVVIWIESPGAAVSPLNTKERTVNDYYNRNANDDFGRGCFAVLGLICVAAIGIAVLVVVL